jgi:hypothetical protein
MGLEVAPTEILGSATAQEGERLGPGVRRAGAVEGECLGQDGSRVDAVRASSFALALSRR